MAKGEEDHSDKKRRRKRSQSSKRKTDDNVNEHDGEVVTESPTSETDKVQLDEGGADERGNENEHEDEKPEDEHQEEVKPKRKRKRKRKSKQEDPSGTSSQEGDDSKASKLSSLDLTVYVEGIPFDCSEEDVRNFFISNGCEDILQLRLPR